MRAGILLVVLAVGCGGEEFMSNPPDAEAGEAGSGASGSPGVGGSAGSGSVDAGAGGERPVAPIGSRCDAEHACVEGAVCRNEVCVALSPVGGVCTVNADCESDNCDEGECAEPRDDYDGPLWVDCSDGSMVARGLYGDFDGVLFSFDSASRGPSWELFPFTPFVNGESTTAGSSVENVALDATTVRAYLDVTYIEGTEHVSLQPSDVVTTSVGWMPSGGGEIPPADIVGCSVTLSDGSSATWEH